MGFDQSRFKMAAAKYYDGVVCSDDIPAGTALGHLDDLLEFLTTSEGAEDLRPSCRHPLEIGRLKHGAYGPDEAFFDSSARRSWTMFTRPATCFLEQNVNICMGTDGRAFLRTSRTVRRNEELFAWMDDRLTCLMGLAAVSPRSIGRDFYTCLSCAGRFRHPNQLKAHLFIRHYCPAIVECIRWSPNFPASPDWNSDPDRNTPAVRIPEDSTPVDFPKGALPPAATVQAASRKNKICPTCGKAFAKKHDLTVHRRRHTREKPLGCRFCDMSFADPSNLIKHEKKHPQYNEPFLCTLCSVYIDGRRNYSVHMRSEHHRSVAEGRPPASAGAPGVGVVSRRPAGLGVTGNIP